jgi:cation diffusion facilitator family transporter
MSDHDHNHNDEHDHNHGHAHHHDHSATHEKKTRWVVILTFVTMVVEICIGYYSNSMALTAEGWHMASHVFAIGLTWIAYILVRKYAESTHVSFHKDKFLALSGFTSAIILLIIAIIMVIESISRLITPESIRFSEAIIVAVIGLVVNGISASVLHHKHEHTDNNIRAAYIHVMADGITSVMAILALLAVQFLHWYSLDALSGILGSIVISTWSFSLIRTSGSVLIDFSRKGKG